MILLPFDATTPSPITPMPGREGASVASRALRHTLSQRIIPPDAGLAVYLLMSRHIATGRLLSRARPKGQSDAGHGSALRYRLVAAGLGIECQDRDRRRLHSGTCVPCDAGPGCRT